ncbi:hypothetical protein CCMSSC00406_0009201 [Pleurotus cornucopiae]|uniref:Uncharacterized protein n=1 Tax=Pleurotus cornucopiae TaxID=5321 RepID=A0ACB7IUU4_PLECO|nr:hypothetical protein CCMSSC00406_0009201 [Pleurotus cornucopiae]
MSSVINNTIWELPSDEKFDGIRAFNPFKVKLEAVAGQWGLKGYLNGHILKPEAATTAATTAGRAVDPTMVAIPGTPPSTPAPTPPYSLHPSLEEWMYRDEKMKSTIAMNVFDLDSLVDFPGEKSSAEIWAELTKTYIRQDEMRKNFADTAFKGMRFDPNSGQKLAEFFIGLRVKRKEAMDFGNRYTDTDFRSTIISSLPGAEFDMLVQGLASFTVPSDLMEQIEFYYSQVENRKTAIAAKPQQLLQADASTSTIQALQAEIARLKSGNKKKKEDKSDKSCTNCKKRGHLAEDCFRDGGGKAGQWPDWWRGKHDGNNPDGGSSSSSNLAVGSLSQHYAFSASANTDDLGSSVPNGGLELDGNPFDIPDCLEDPEEVEYMIDVSPMKWSEDDFDEIWAGTSEKWENVPNDQRIQLLNATIGIIEAKEFVQTVLDSGATDHFITSRESFITYEAVPPYQGSGSKKGSKFTIVGRGRATKTFIVNGEERTITFDALHTPDVTSDLISVSKLDGKGLSILFSKGTAHVYDGKEKLILTATKRSGLYVFDVKDPPAANVARSLEKPVNMDTWHRRYGHAGIDRIRESFNKSLVDGGRVEGASSEEKCVPCVHGKGTRRPFDADVVPSTEPLARVHTDLCGPMRVQGRGGFLYSMPIVDDGTSFTKQYYLKDKSAETTLKAMENYRVECERQTGKKLKVVRVDGGGEFDNALWHAWGEKHGIIIEIIPAHSSAANGVAERRHRSIYSRVRTILFDSKLPTSLWCWTAEYVVYTDNLLPSSRYPGTIPAETFRGKRQSVGHLRPFGCRGYAKVVDGKPGKLDDQVVEGRMVGYDERGVYWLYLNDGRIVRSRDVVFDETLGQPTDRTRIVNDVFEGEPDLIPREDRVDDEVPAAPVDHDQESEGVDPELLAPATQPVIKRKARKDPDVVTEPVRRSTRIVPSKMGQQSVEYQEREKRAAELGDPWANDLPAKRVHAQAKMTLAETNPFKFLPESVNYMDAADNVALTAVGLPPVSATYAEAMRDPDRWQPAMDEEMARMKAFEVFGPSCDSPKSATILGVKWVYAHKFNGLGEIVGEKARLVVQGQHQVEGRDFYKKYAGVMRLESLRMLLAVWVMLGFVIWQVDFKSAYLNVKMEEELYVRLPKGFQGTDSSPTVVRLWRSLYGAVQAGNNWWRELDAAYADLDYVRSEADQCVRS